MSKPKTKLAVVMPLLEGDGTPQQHFRSWINEVSDYMPIVGSGSPEGVVEARQYSTYIDESSPGQPTVYRKMLTDINSDRRKGWVSAAALESLSVTNGAEVSGGVTADSLTVSGDLDMTGGTVKLTGDSTVWNDLRTSLIGRRLNSTAGTVTYDYTENAVVFSANGGIDDSNDTAVWNFQLPHDAKLSVLKVHMHYEQADATNRTFTLRYRIQANGGTKTTAWTTVTADTDDSAFTYVSGTLNNILPLATIDISSAGLSAVVQCQMTRTDAQAGTVNVSFVDAHYEIDQLGGSDDEYVK